MKYLLLIGFLCVPAFAQECVPVIKSGEYKLKTGGEYLVNPCGGKPCLNQADAKNAQIALVKSKGVRVDVVQPNLVGTCAASSSASSRPASSSSVAQSSASSVARVTATWTCALTRVDGTPMTEAEIGGYYLKIGDATPINLKHTGCKMAHVIDAPAPGVTVKVSEYDTSSQASNYVAFE